MRLSSQPIEVSVRPNPLKTWLQGQTVYSVAQACVAFLCFAYVISVPVGITYDGHLYIDLADILGSHRFPADWSPARTPLFPLALKFSFWAFGKQSLAAIVVTSVAGLGGILVLGKVVRDLAGIGAGAISLIVLALYPTLVSYEHYVLSETGIFFFLAAMIWISLWTPTGRRGLWWKTAGLVVACTAGYYWRQNLLFMAPWLALLHAMGSMREWYVKSPFRISPLARIVGLQCLLIVVLPNAAARPWNRLSNNGEARDLMLRFGIIKQALAPPDDPFIGPDAPEYRQAILDSTPGGNFYSGILAQFSNPLANKIFSRYQGPALNLFIRLVRTYPGRYTAAAGRTAILFAGAKGAQDENDIFRDQLLSPTTTGAKIGEGPEPLSSKDRDYFAQSTQDSAFRALLRHVTAVYDPVLIAGSAISVAGLLLSIAFRDFRAFVVTATPVVYLLPYIFLLSSVDRYAFPAHPFFLVSPFVVFGGMIMRWASLRRMPDSPQPIKSRNKKTAALKRRVARR